MLMFFNFICENCSRCSCIIHHVVKLVLLQSNTFVEGSERATALDSVSFAEPLFFQAMV